MFNVTFGLIKLIFGSYVDGAVTSSLWSCFLEIFLALMIQSHLVKLHTNFVMDFQIAAVTHSCTEEWHIQVRRDLKDRNQMWI